MKIAVEGCAHGELEKIYETLKELEINCDSKIDLLICCGDFQATRNKNDLNSMAVPQKYQKMCTFYKYYSGEKVAPVLTLFIGGNHEASNYLQELPYGGWVAPNIYYLGYAGVVNFGGVRIGGISGIFKGQDYLKGRFECPPYNADSKRSVYHVRNLEVFRLKQLKDPIDIMISHDWPRGIYNYGNVEGLLNRKSFFRDEIETNSLGSQANEELLFDLKPSFWFAAHLHCKFAALVPHKTDDVVTRITKFLALDKCLPKRKFLQLVDIPLESNEPLELHYDLEWLTVLFLTNHLLNVSRSACYMPGPGSMERWKFTPTPEELSCIKKRFNDDLKVPLNFVRTATPYGEDPNMSFGNESPFRNNSNGVQLNSQTVEFCEKLYIDDPMVLLKKIPSKVNLSLNSSGASLSSLFSPDKGDTTFIDSESSFTSPLQTTLNNESFDLSTPTKTNRSSLSSLALPPPKNTTIDNSTDEDVLDWSAEKRKSSLDATSTGAHGEAIEDPVEGIIKLPEVPDSTSSPVVKKFKRRNEAIYTSTDDDV